jgi:uncharacterized membrane protein
LLKNREASKILAAVIAPTASGNKETINYIEGAYKMSINRADKKYWKLKVFYFNKEDKALFVQKKLGIGIAINYANPISLVIIAAFVAVIILLKLKNII